MLGLVGLGVRSLASSGHVESRTSVELARPAGGWLSENAPTVRCPLPLVLLHPD